MRFDPGDIHSFQQPTQFACLKVGISHASNVFDLQALRLETGGNRVSISGQVGDWPQLADTELD